MASGPEAPADLDEVACKQVFAEIEAGGGCTLAVGADVTDEDAVSADVTRVVAELGAPTVLVNNAGIIRDNLLFTVSVAGGAGPTTRRRGRGCRGSPRRWPSSWAGSA